MASPGHLQSGTVYNRHVSDRVSHLQMIQAVISRIASNSFLIKGWSLTVTSVLFALAANRTDWRVAVAAILPAVVFWGLDALFLRQERLFRKLYDDVRKNTGDVDFSMNTVAWTSDAAVGSVLRVMFSRTLAWFHITILVLAVGLLVTFAIAEPASMGDCKCPAGSSSASTINATSGESTRSGISPESPDAPLPDSRTPPYGSAASSVEMPPSSG